jgi:hypothetical protein
MDEPISDPCSCSQAGATHQRGDEDFCRGGAVEREFQCCEPDLTLNSAVEPQDNINPPDPNSGMPETVASLHGATTGEETATETQPGASPTANELDRLRFELAFALSALDKVTGRANETRDALARVTQERDEARSDAEHANAITEVFRRKLDEDTDQRDKLLAAVTELQSRLAFAGKVEDDLLTKANERGLAVEHLRAERDEARAVAANAETELARAQEELTENVGVINALRRHRDAAEAAIVETRAECETEIRLRVDRNTVLAVALEVTERQRRAALALHAREDTSCSYCFDDRGEHSDWPCPTAEALGATDGG